MNKNVGTALVTLVLWIASAGYLAADEIWRFVDRTIEWEDSVGTTAVLKFESPKGPAGSITRVYVFGLASDVNGGRGSYRGYWISSDQTITVDSCPISMVDHAGRASRNWGQVEITFLKPGIPSDWTGRWSGCAGERPEILNGFAQ